MISSSDVLPFIHFGISIILISRDIIGNYFPNIFFPSWPVSWPSLDILEFLSCCGSTSVASCAESAKSWRSFAAFAAAQRRRWWYRRPREPIYVFVGMHQKCYCRCISKVESDHATCFDMIPGVAIFKTIYLWIYDIYLRSEPVAGAWCLHAVRLGAAVSICQWWSKDGAGPSRFPPNLDDLWCFRSPWNLCRLQALGNEDSTIRVCGVLRSIFQLQQSELDGQIPMNDLNASRTISYMRASFTQDCRPSDFLYFLMDLHSFLNKFNRKFVSSIEFPLLVVILGSDSSNMWIHSRVLNMCRSHFSTFWYLGTGWLQFDFVVFVLAQWGIGTMLVLRIHGQVRFFAGGEILMLKDFAFVGKFPVE